MKSIFTKTLGVTLLAGASIFVLNSCDSSSSANEPLTGAAALAATAISLDAVIGGDSIEYRPTDFTKPFIGSITFTGVTTTIGDIAYTYAKSGDNEFTITAQTNANNALQTALDNTVGGDLNAPLNTRIRDLLRRTDPTTLTNAEIQEILDILNPHGANLQPNANGDGLRIPINQIYSHTITSSEEDRQKGTMGGFYKLQSFGSNIIFRTATAEEALRYRFFDGHLLPVISTETFVDNDDERGIFNIQFVNSTS